MLAACSVQALVAVQCTVRVGIYSHFWLLLHEYTLLYMYLYMYIDIQHIQYTDSMAPSFVKFCQVYHAFARTHTSVYFGPILLLHEYTLHSYTTKYTLHYVYCSPGRACTALLGCGLWARRRRRGFRARWPPHAV